MIRILGRAWTRELRLNCRAIARQRLAVARRVRAKGRYATR